MKRSGGEDRSTGVRTKPSRASRDPLWFRDAVFYELRVGAFYDSDGDGIGDFRGLAQKLDYLQDLGVTTLWLLPFYPSPLRDDGYDISDFTSVHGDSGTLEDFKLFLREAHRRGLRVVTELVINHTSDQHPWFQRARRAPRGSRWRDYYVWSDTPDRYREARIIFKDFERSNWTWDEVAGAYYWHRFYSHQPDLNFEHPEVRKAVFRVLDFWFDMGVDGLRLDAIPYLYEREGTNCENLPETHAFLKELRAHVDRNYDDRMLLAEANQWPEDAVAYLGRGDECHMAFHFPVMPRLFMALHMEDRFPIMDILEQTPEIPDTCQWALFLRNHDELTLEMVTDEERDYMYRVYAHDTQARINLGIRRRLAPLLGNDRRRIELMNALLFSLPGTPVIYYGDEIGMGDNFYLGDRNGVRTPMQWSADRNAGFSRTNPQRLYLPVVVDPEYHYESRNVEAQSNNLHSLLFWMKRVIALRKQHRAFGRGSISFLTPSNRKVLAFVRVFDGETLLVVANLSRFVEYVELDLSTWKGMVAVELFGKKPFPPIGDLPYLLTLGPHSFYWFSLEHPEAGGAAARFVSATEAVSPVLRARGTWRALLRNDERRLLLDTLARVLRDRGWLSGVLGRTGRVSLIDTVEVPGAEVEAFLAILRCETPAVAEIYVLPVAFADGERAAHVRETARHAVIAEVDVEGRQGVANGVLYDALEEPSVAVSLLETIARKRPLRGEAGDIVPQQTRAFRALRGPAEVDLAPALRRPEVHQHEVVLGKRMVLRVPRGIVDGVNAELEVGRFLTERASFVNVAPIGGWLEYRASRKPPVTLAILQGHVPSEGDAFRFTVDCAQQFFQHALARAASGDLAPDGGTPVELIDRDPPPLALEMMAAYIEFARTLGMRTAELHLALASDAEDPVFAPEEFTMLYQRSLYQSLRNQALRLAVRMREAVPSLPDEVQAEARAVLDAEPRVLRQFGVLRARRFAVSRIRIHGDLELAHVLCTGRDVVIADLEAGDRLGATERRLKVSPLRDVASMLWSFHHAVRGGLVGDGSAALVRPEDVDVLQPWAYFFASWAGSSFLRGYLRRAHDAQFVPRTKRDLAALLLIFGLKKCIDEAEHALERRPAWLRVPLRGISDVLLMADGGRQR